MKMYRLKSTNLWVSRSRGKRKEKRRRKQTKPREWMSEKSNQKHERKRRTMSPVDTYEIGIHQLLVKCPPSSGIYAHRVCVDT